MMAALTGFFDWSPPARETAAPERKPVYSPVFISDIVTARLDDPELLVRWREANVNES